MIVKKIREAEILIYEVLDRHSLQLRTDISVSIRQLLLSNVRRSRCRNNIELFKDLQLRLQK